MMNWRVLPSNSRCKKKPSSLKENGVFIFESPLLPYTQTKHVLIMSWVIYECTVISHNTTVL